MKAEPIQFLEKGPEKPILVGPHVADPGRGGYQSDAFRLFRLLRHGMPHRRRNH
jgi:hypothetical protein